MTPTLRSFKVKYVYSIEVDSEMNFVFWTQDKTYQTFYFWRTKSPMFYEGPQNGEVLVK